MFNFMKKSGSGNKKEKGSANNDDFARTEEGRKSLKLRHRRKDKEKEKLPSGITADYSANFFADINRERLVESPNGFAVKCASDYPPVTDKVEARGTVTSAPAIVSFVASPSQSTALPRALPLPPLPPRVAKKTVSASANAAKSAVGRRVVSVPSAVEHGIDESSTSASSRYGATRALLEDDVVDFAQPPFHEGIDSSRIQNSSSSSSSLLAANLDKGDDRSEKCASVESLTDSTTNSSFVTPPFSSSPVGEGQGFYSKFADLASFSGSPDQMVAAAASDFPLPEIESSHFVAQARELLVSRPTGSGDFGFVLRRAVTVDRSSDVPRLRSVIVAEAKASFSRLDASHQRVGLLPGDQLLEVNGVSVDGSGLEEIIELIELCDSSVRLKVRSLPELSELSRRYRDDGTSVELDESNIQFGTLKRSGSKRFKQSEGKSDRQLESEKSWLDFKRMWLIHKAGFTAVRVLSRRVDSGKVDVCLEATGEQASVDEDDIEPANLPRLDRCEDLAQLRYLNESSALHTLRQRFGSNLIHTYAGPTMVIVNPMVPLNIYTDQVAQMFRGCKAEDMPAHVFSLAQSAYHETITSRRDHSIVFIGRSGSGKTVNYKQVLQYLVSIAPNNNKNLDTEKLNAIWTILESFGNAKTALNSNATRFTHLFGLDIDHTGQIVSASVQLFYCEKWRLVRRSESEHAFHILYKLMAGADGTLRKELAFDQIIASDQNFLFSPLLKTEKKHSARMEFNHICSSFKLIGVSDIELKTVFRVLAGIVHLGYAGVSKSSNSGKYQFSQPAAAQRAAKCLGTTVEELSHLIFTQIVPTTTNHGRASISHPSPTDCGKSQANDHSSGVDALEGFIVGLYVELFNLVGSYVNRCISTNAQAVNSILVLDCPGFQNPASCGQLQNGASFSDLCHNYFQERLQLLFHQTNIDDPRERYAQEHVQVTLDKCDDISPEPIVTLLDNSPTSSYLRGSQADLRQSPLTDKCVPGLLWLLDDIGSWQSINDCHIVDRIFTSFSDRENHQLIRKAPGNNHFIIQHYLGTNPVLYRADGWLKQNKENPFLKMALTFLQDSKNKDIASAFVGCKGAGLTTCVAILDCSSQSLRRVSSIRRTFAGGFKRRSQSLKFKFTTDGVVETLRKTRIKFAHCFLPHHDAGLIDKSGNGSSASSSFVLSHSSVINIPLLRSQLRGSEILPVVRLNKQGFPKSMSLAEFQRRFSLLSKNDSLLESTDDRATVENILIDAEVDHSSYRIGFSEVFFRSGVLAQLEALRDDKLVDLIRQFQAYCRGYLSRKRVAKLKIEDVAIRCIQRNVRKFTSVRHWPWWRLLVRIAPLLNVHRTEQELKSKTEELESLRSWLEKLELERNTLRQENVRLDAKLREVTVDLAEEHSSASLANERLELETAERLRLEQEILYLQGKNQTLQENGEKLETELLCLKTADLNGTIGLENEEGFATDDSSGGSAYKQRYERASRELEYTKRRLQQQHHDDLEQLVALRKQLEKKISDAYEEVEEQRQVVAQWKRKVQKLNGEMSDLRLMLEDGNSRNNILEKKQRKFDSEVQILQDEVRQEKQTRERISREKELLAADKYALEQNLQTLKMDLELKDQKLSNLNKELQEITFGGTTEEEVTRLRKIRHDLENKIAEQEEDLNDLADQVHVLSQAKLRLEMNLEQVRKEHKKELSQRDDENEEMRCNTVKKVKALESQLESEHEERTMLLRERHELERKLADVEDRERCARNNDHELVSRLKRDLKKTRILLHDARLMLQQVKSDAPNKAMLRQLRNQLEDAECARNTAVKARQMAEADLADIASTLEEIQKAKTEAEEKAACYARERAQLQSQLDENEEELAEVLKKYGNAVQQLSNEQLTLHEQANRIAELESERCSLKEQLAEVTSRLESIETHGDPTSSLAVKRFELKTKELESKLDLEQTTRSRMEVQIGRLKEVVDRLQQEVDGARAKETLAQESVRKLQRALREARESLATSEVKEAAEAARKRELEKRIEQMEIELGLTKADLKLALQRVEDLQCAIQGDLEDDDDDDDADEDDDDDDDDDDEDIDDASESDRAESGNSNESLRSFVARTSCKLSVDRWLNNGSESKNEKI